MLNNKWRDALTGFSAHLRAGGRTPQTIRLRTQHLTQLASSHLDPWAVTGDHLVTWVASHTWADATLYSVRSTLRTFYGWGVDSGLTATNPADALPGVRRRPPSPHPLDDGALERALARADWREWLIMSLAARCGMRRGEIARCRTDDVFSSRGGWSIVVRGKGRRDRIVPIPDAVAAAVVARPRGYVFPGEDEGHLSPEWVGIMASRMLPSGYGLHSLRHRFATTVYDQTRDAFTVQRLLGHASPETTLRYVQLPDDAMRAAMLAAS